MSGASKGLQGQSGPEVLLGLVGDIYQAGLEPERWPSVIAGMSQVFEADMACIYTPIVERPEQSLYLTYNFDQAMESAYQAYYHSIDEWSGTALRQHRYVQGQVALGEEIIPQRELRRTEFYQDFLKHYDMEWIVSTVLFEPGPETPATHMTFTRNLGRRAYDGQGVKLMQMLAPHVRRALLTQWRLAGARLEKLFHGAALESLGYGLAVVDEARKVYYLNRRAETLLRSNTGLVLRGGCLHAENPETDHALKRLVQDASKGMGGGIAVAVMPAREAIHRQAAQYGLSAIPLKEEAAISELARFARLPGRGVLLLIQDPLRVDAQAGLMPFAARHRITPAELRVLERLVAGLAPKQIADQFGLRISTVRTQLSQLFLKTSTRNQRELVSLALRSGGGQQ